MSSAVDRVNASLRLWDVMVCVTAETVATSPTAVSLLTYRYTTAVVWVHWVEIQLQTIAVVDIIIVLSPSGCESLWYRVRPKVSPKFVFHFLSNRLNLKREISHTYYLFIAT